MKRTKPKGNTLPSGSRNISTQTENFDSFIVAKLEEQVKMMQLEINVLRKHVDTSKRSDDVVHQKAVSLTPQAAAKINNEKSSCGRCGCKGNCSSRICGCVKKNNRCNPSCKCDNKVCQNQKPEYNQENKENVSRTDETPKNQSRWKNEATGTNKNKRSLFSPEREISAVFEEIQFSDIDFGLNEKNAVAKSLETDSQNVYNVKLKEKKKEKKGNDKEQHNSKEKIIFDPMKPRHQLSRTPPKKLEKSIEVENTIQPRLHSISQEMMITPSLKKRDTEEEKVDWDQHTAQLIPCKKCKRTFMPDRIQKHEACCQKI